MILLWAWIKPIAVMSDWTEPDKIVPLFGAVGLCICLDMLRTRAWASVPLKGAAAFLAVGWLFRHTGGHSGIGLDWFSEYASLFTADVHYIATGNPADVSAESRTLIFLAGWILLAGVVQSILVYRRRALWVCTATWLYLIGLQLWPGVDTTGEMIASGAAGTAMLAVLQLDRVRSVYATGLLRWKPTESLETEHGSTGSGESGASKAALPIAASRRYSLPGPVPPGIYAAVLTVTLVLFAGALAGAGRQSGVMAPFHEGLWSTLADALIPERGLSGGTEAVFSGRAREGVTGYGGDDSILGGPLTVKDEPVFAARTPEATYWRGESKSYYDGKGWSSMDASSATVISRAEEQEKQAAGGITVTQEIMYHGPKPLNILFAGGDIEKVEALYSLEGRELPLTAVEAEPVSGRYAIASGSGQLGYARMQVHLPQNSPEQLIAASGPVPKEIETAYLQLPDKLPQRVKELAEEVVSEGVTPYAKALLVKQYLQEHYRYSLTEVAVPGREQDFVDAFLFGGNAGYCDYFSTAMAVMLRSVGVPTRWVKGFSPGEASSGEGNLLTVEINSKNAHSWVEVFLPQTGWVAMDPTPGFTGFAGSTAAVLPALLLSQPGSAGAKEPREVWALAALTRPDFHAMGQAIQDGLGWTGEQTRYLIRDYGLLIAGCILVLIPAVYLIRTRSYLLPLLLLLGTRQRGQKGTLLVRKLLDKLWLKVFRLYGMPLPGQTLREYAVEAGARVPVAEEKLLQLVRLYEELRYSRGEVFWVRRQHLAQLWQSLLSPQSGSRSIFKAAARSSSAAECTGARRL
jgi:hypothetical protein